MRESTVFTGVCLFTFWGRVQHPRSGGGYLIQVWMVGGGYPIPGMGVPHPRGFSSQVLIVGVPGVPPTPGLDGGGGGNTQGTPQLGLDGGGVPGVPPATIKTWPGYPANLGWCTPPPSRPDWGTPHPGMGFPPDLGWGTPHSPPSRPGQGTPHPTH